MKRILIVFALLACFALPAQVASAYSYNTGMLFEENIAGLAIEAGGRTDFFPTFFFMNSDKMDLIQLYSSFAGDPLNATENVNGFAMLQGVKPQEVFLNLPSGGNPLLLNITQALTVKGTSGAVYEYNGNSLDISAGAIFLHVSTSEGQAVFLVAPAGKYNPVPVPAAVWLAGTGLAGLVALRRRQR